MRALALTSRTQQGTKAWLADESDFVNTLGQYRIIQRAKTMRQFFHKKTSLGKMIFTIRCKSTITERRLAACFTYAKHRNPANLSIMTIETAVDIMRQTVWTAFLLMSPILATAVIVGLAISLIQTVTSIQEQTLAFVPKLICVGLVTVAVSGWMLKTLVEFTLQMFARMSQLG
jgi:flagellar biosynthesis protein FliQ